MNEKGEDSGNLSEKWQMRKENEIYMQSQMNCIYIKYQSELRVI